MKRLVIMTVGKTHSGKTTFARDLELALNNAFIMDQDNTAEFLHTYYEKLLPNEGPNILKHTISRTIVDHAIRNTDLHLIICNSNRSRKSRTQLLETLFTKDKFVRILVNFNIADDVLQARVIDSQRSTKIFRRSTLSFKQVLDKQNAESLKEDIMDPDENEADYVFNVHVNEEANAIIQKIIAIAQN